MSYTSNELKEIEAYKAWIQGIIGDKERYAPSELRDLMSALKDNEETCVDTEQYHLAMVYNEEYEKLV